MNDKIKNLLQYLSDHVVSTGYRDDSGDYNYRVEGLVLSSKQVADLDEILRLSSLSETGKQGAESGKAMHEAAQEIIASMIGPSPWITCEEVENTPIMFCRITGIDTWDNDYEGNWGIIFDTLDDSKTWTFDKQERRNEVYTKVYGRINPEVL